MNDFRSFTDKNGRKIHISCEDDVYAYHNGKEIGKIAVDHRDEGPILWSIDVEESYRRAGIATEMMKVVADLHGKDIGRPSSTALGGKFVDSEDYYTEEGASLIAHCVKKGILIDTEYPNGINLDQ